VLHAVRAYSATADAPRRASRTRQIRDADEAIERANADLDDTIRQLGELGLLGRPASQETLEKLTTSLDDAHTVRARLGDGGESNVIGPDDIDKLREPAKRSAAWRRLITDTVESVTVAPAMTADGRPSRLWDPRRIDTRFAGPASLRKPPAAASRASVDTLRSYDSQQRCRPSRSRTSPSGTTVTTARSSRGRSTSPVLRDSSRASATRASRPVAPTPRERQPGPLASPADRLESKHNGTPVREAKRGCGLAGDGGDGRRHGAVSQLATSRARAVVEARPAFVVAHDTRRRAGLTTARGGERTFSWARTGEVRAEELAGAGQGSVAFVEHLGESLEHMRNAGCYLERDGDVGRGGLGSEPGGVIEQDLV
jgi:hypothetical protein